MMQLSVGRKGASARLLVAFAALILVVAACGDAGERESTEQPSTTASSSTSPTTETTKPQPTATSQPAATTEPVTTNQPVTTSQPVTGTTAAMQYAFATYGAGSISLPGSGDMLGSGCSPGSSTLPDGIWFGVVDRARATSIDFDLACVDDRTPPLVSNQSPQLRNVDVAPTATVFRSGSGPTPYDTWTPPSEPVWIYVNAGTVTEIAIPTIDIRISRPGSATWHSTTEAAFPVGGGCCDSNHNGPASPTSPWPAKGLPADGVYMVTTTLDRAANELALTIYRFVDCATNQVRCTQPINPGDVAVDWSNAIVRQILMDRDLIVRIDGIQPVSGSELPSGIEGSGTAFAALLNELQNGWERAVEPLLAANRDHSEVYAELMAQGEADPTFPYGPADALGFEGMILSLRGPLGLQMTTWLESPLTFHGWSTQLEIVDGKPILYIWAGQLAG